MQKTRKTAIVLLFSAPNTLANKSDLNLTGSGYLVNPFRLGRLWTKLGVALDIQRDTSYRSYNVDGYSFPLN